jgi:EmrB/QacA subfamily drug resistance transporter
MINPKARPCDEAAIRAVRSEECAANVKAWVLVATILASAIAFIDESVVNIALPAMEKDLGASVAVIQWIVSAYELCLAALLLIGGAVGDRYGRRLAFVIGMTIFAVTSLWCGLAGTIGQLLAARAAQGVGAALMIPCSLAIIGATFNEAERGKAIGTWAGVSAIAAAAGPLLGGWIVDHATWRTIFLINPVLAVPTIWIALRHMPETRDSQATGALDWHGAALSFLGLGLLVFGLIALPSWGGRNLAVVTSIAVGIALLTAFVAVEMRSRHPMMPPGLFRSPIFSGVNLLTLLLYTALGGAFFFLPFDLMQVHGYSATVAGMSFLPFTVIMGGLSRWSGGLIDRLGARLPLVIGPAICAVAYALFAFADATSSYAMSFFLPICVLSLGMAVTVAPLTTAVINAVPPAQTGVASGINNSVASVASLLAVAIFGAIALGVHDRALDRHAGTASAGISRAIETSRGQFVIEPALSGLQGAERAQAATLLQSSLADGIQAAMILAAALSLAAGLCAAVTIPAQAKRGRAAVR